ncbi:MAG: C4-dicarboxylate ABC transporter permease, partial [Pseudomonadota bacterium]
LMFAGLGLTPFLGFGAAGVAMGLALILPAQHGALSRRGWALTACAAAATIAGMTLAFRELLSVPLPAGALF